MDIEIKSHIEVPEKETDNLKRLPSWVKCMVCGKPPRHDDWLYDMYGRPGEVQSNALIHMSCAGKKGKFAGLNLKGESK